MMVTGASARPERHFRQRPGCITSLIDGLSMTWRLARSTAAFTFTERIETGIARCALNGPPPSALAPSSPPPVREDCPLHPISNNG